MNIRAAIRNEIRRRSTANAGRGGDIMFYDFCK
jgi:hypothetical protein